jgi:hypothetical protein
LTFIVSNGRKGSGSFVLKISRLEKYWLLEIDSELSITGILELKQVLMDWAVSGRDLYLDLGGSQAIDVSAIQLLWAANCHASDVRAAFVSRVSEAVAMAAREAGFEQFPGARTPGALWPK